MTRVTDSVEDAQGRQRASSSRERNFLSLVERLAASLSSTLPSARRAGCARASLQVDDVMFAIAMCADVITEPGDRAGGAERWVAARRLVVPGMVHPQWIVDHPQTLDHPTEN